MIQICHLIELVDGCDPSRFEEWVATVDYRACRDLSSVAEFTVTRLDDGRYREYIIVESETAFAEDMRTEVFDRLERDFSTMARVVDEMIEHVLWPAYRTVASDAA